MMRKETPSSPFATKLVGHILKVAQASGEFALAIAGPGALRTHNVSSLANPQPPQQRYYNKTVIARLVNQGYLMQADHRLVLTKRGEKLLDRYQVGDLTIKPPRRWNGEYHVIIFDIKESQRRIRDEIRFWLTELGFVRLQNSVWVHPYECQGVIALLKARFGIGKDLLYLVVKSIENDRWLKEHFGLS